VEKQTRPLTDLQCKILDGMVDDYEDVEQLYLFANRELAREEAFGIRVPELLLQIQFSLREITDEIASMLREGYIEAKYSSDAELVPLRPLDFSALHHYWFGPTAKGLQALNACKKHP
jgi:hypothetical protein